MSTPGTPPPFNGTKYITHIPGRSPEWKAHVSLAKATTAVNHKSMADLGRTSFALWEFVGGDWRQIPL